MAKNLTITEQIQNIAIDILAENPDGVKFADLKRMIYEQNNAFNINTIQRTVVELDSTCSDKVYKRIRGLFRHTKFKEDITTQPDQQATTVTKSNKEINIQEKDFYLPFAEWIETELEECTKVIELGGNIFRDKWGTPDIIGVRESKRSDIIQFPTEIVVGEIKIDTNALIIAFGQACAYKIFSHKSYVVVPNDSQIEDITRLDILCRQFGIGLILFNSKKPEEPNFEIRARAVKHEPDMFFVNKYLKLVEDRLFK